VILTSNGSAIEFAPRLDAPLEDLDEGVALLKQAIEEVEREL